MVWCLQALVIEEREQQQAAVQRCVRGAYILRALLEIALGGTGQLLNGLWGILSALSEAQQLPHVS